MVTGAASGLGAAVARMLHEEGATVVAVGKLNPAIRAETAARTPLGRLGTADEVASLMSFLHSGAASYITGQTYLIDGGSYA